MSHEGFVEFLCQEGHYYTGCDDSTSNCPICDKKLKYFHRVDVTNGYDEDYPETCEAPKEIAYYQDVWKVDHYGNRYAIQNPVYYPTKDSLKERIWIKY